MMTLKQKMTCWLAFLICWFFHKSYRYHFFNVENYEKARKIGKNGGYAIASWHQNCFAGILSHSGKPLSLLVSRSFDGELIAFIAKKLGLGVARGSSSKGGKEALSVLVDRVSSGQGSAFTVDGPRGPAHKVKNGILSIATKTEAAILPVAAIGDVYWTLNSWDKFRLPKPFSKILICYGEPYVLSKDLSEDLWEIQRNKLEEELSRIDILAHEKLGLKSSQEATGRA